jgi:hypothetical protein
MIYIVLLYRTFLKRGKRTSAITRLKSNAHTEVVPVLQRSATLHDAVIRLGSGSGACTHLMRVIAVQYQGKWYRYLTNETDPVRLPAASVVALYWQRWRIEEALNVVKRLLGLASFWAGSLNAIQMQFWATWIVYAVLIERSSCFRRSTISATSAGCSSVRREDNWSKSRPFKADRTCCSNVSQERTIFIGTDIVIYRAVRTDTMPARE